MKSRNLPEFVGTAVLDTIGLVIPSADDQLLSFMEATMKTQGGLPASGRLYKSLGVFSSRTGAAGQINAIDEAVKSHQCPGGFPLNSPRGHQGLGRPWETLSYWDRITYPIHAGPLKWPWNIRINMPENFTLVRRAIWNSHTRPMPVPRSMKPSALLWAVPSASYAAPPPPLAWSWRISALNHRKSPFCAI